MADRSVRTPVPATDSIAGSRIRAAGQRNEKKQPRAGRIVRGVVGVLVFLLIGEVIGRIGLVDRSYLPPSSAVLARAARLIVNGGFLHDVGWTLTAWAVGLLIAAVIAVPVGLLLGSLPFVNSAVRMLIEFLRPIPAVALIPLVILMIAEQAQIEQTLAAYAAVWPILINTIYAVGDVDPVPREMARSFGMGRLVILTRVALPSVAPFVATGIRVASSIALIVTISTELISGGGEHGIGIFILNASANAGQADVVFAAAGIAGLLGFLIDLAMRALERRLFRWHFERLGRAS
ncbi:ABC transporter permease [Actinoallomurus acaciae]|uniref:ABC transporter permease n=1 Tax=Actinoallomurus acaciae TaxID=502577 RepID=A0ABV5YNM5_9ACTN